MLALVLINWTYLMAAVGIAVYSMKFCSVLTLLAYTQTVDGDLASSLDQIFHQYSIHT